MIKKVINFLDNHRLVLIIIIILFISLIFLTYKSYNFLNYNFKSLRCTQDIDDIYCFNNDIKIFKEPKKYKEEYFKSNSKIIKTLQENYNLPEYNNYTSYYYEITSLIDYEMNRNNKELYEFFHIYNNTYNIEKFYIENNLYFQIFYKYKIA